MAKWLIFDYYKGDFIRQNDVVILFETLGLAHQFLEQYRKPRFINKTKDYTISYQYYNAPFKFIEKEDYEKL